MKIYRGALPALLGAATLVAIPGCGDAANSSASQTAGASEATTSSTDSPTTSGSNSNSNSNSNTATDGTGSASMTSLPTTGDPGSTTQTSMTSSTTSEPETSTTMPVSTTDSSTTDSTGTTDPDTTSTTDPDTTTSSTSDSDSSSTTGPDCVPIEEVCNDLDDDCNGIVDDLDIAGDGICDCLNIALFGKEGSNESAQFQAWLEAQGTKVDRILLDNSPITQDLLDQYDIVILDWLVRSYTPEEAALVNDWVTSGGGLMSMTGHTNNNTVVDRPNSIIGPMGLSYNASKGFFDGPVTQWLKPHPLTEGITSVSFYGGLYINMVDDGIGTNEAVGTLQQGPVAVAQVRKTGKLYIFGDEWIEFDSEWQQIPEIKQLWVNILAWLSPQNYCTVPQ